MQLIYENDRFVLLCSYLQRLEAQKSGFRWDAALRHWWTSDVRKAAKFLPVANSLAAKRIQKIFITVGPAQKALWPLTKKPLSFQIKEAEWALQRNRAYLALDPGLGKTIIAAMMRNALSVGVVYISPPYLMRNVREELIKWASSKVPEVTINDEPTTSDSVWIVSDAILGRAELRKKIQNFADRVRLLHGESVLICDESHRFKALDAIRTQAVFKSLMPWFDRTYFMSGTPMPNRPFELWPVINYAAPEVVNFMTKFEYCNRYCAAKETAFGWDYSGASNVAELRDSLNKTFMHIVDKKSVLPELPPKTEELVFLEDDRPKHIKAFEAKLMREHAGDDILGMGQFDGVAMPTYRRELGSLKASHAIKYILALLSETDEVIIVFSIHRDVIKKLAEQLKSYAPLVITGDTPMKTRHEIVKEFQENSKRRLFIGNIQAAGTGFTLTKATRVIFIEFSWVPGENDQASDRSHRIGQKDHVFVQYLVYPNSLDRSILETLFKKKRNINILRESYS